MSLENDVEEPEKSQIFSKYPKFLKDHHARDFVCDSLRMAITGAVTPLDLDQMMETDLDVHHGQEGQTVSALTTVADALPGLGIVAAVLGVVITMGALGGPPEQIGEKVAAALVGTFLGILMCYGLVGPLSSSMAKRNEEEGAYLAVLRTVLTSFIKGTTPLLALEIGRRAIPGHVRPSFKELEKTCKGGSAPAAS
jgi:chemotaxis protein MotA